ncbi:hypothetical protein MKW98_015843 [Papaver atlanticum]|uniref:non-specific serine/threonine protein kinase n=1 Tax=Papaver atlanticum TaxID=357466 RepID=A0AAD4T4B3_9MAGN|nr:hypothetical protein MKW98_015843 [Papaver atlanticum]
MDPGRRAETSLNNAGPGQTWIRREISTMKLIKHPYIVQVMGSKAKIFIVLEFVTGGELFEKVVTCLLMILTLWSCFKKFRLQSIFILLGSLWALRLITRILDPNPTTEIDDINLDDVKAVFKGPEGNPMNQIRAKKEEQPVAMNAFELISLSRGLNLGNLFEVEQVHRAYPFL